MMRAAPLLALLLAAGVRPSSGGCHGPPFDRPALWTFPVENSLDEFFQHDPAYGAEFWFAEALRQDSAASACSAADAQLFYLPTFHVRVNSNGVTQWHLFRQHLANMTAAGLPEGWALNRTMMFLTGDWGPCSMAPDFAEALWVTHFGLHVDHDSQPCHDPSRWVVAPGHQWKSAELLRDARASADAPRGLLFTYYGEPHGNGAPARNATIQNWGGRLAEGFSVGLYTADGRSMSADMRNSSFCGAPHGGGWGSRLSNAVLRGCIPVILQDDSTLPLEPFLDYSQFAVRVALADIPRLDVILRAYSAQQVADMRHRLLQVAPFFDWDHRAGGRAMEGTLATVYLLMQRRGLLPADIKLPTAMTF